MTLLRFPHICSVLLPLGTGAGRKVSEGLTGEFGLLVLSLVEH